MAPKVLVVLTSQNTIPKTGQPTGWYLVRSIWCASFMITFFCDIAVDD